MRTNLLRYRREFSSAAAEFRFLVEQSLRVSTMQECFLLQRDAIAAFERARSALETLLAHTLETQSICRIAGCRLAADDNRASNGHFVPQHRPHERRDRHDSVGYNKQAGLSPVEGPACPRPDSRSPTTASRVKPREPGLLRLNRRILGHAAARAARRDAAATTPARRADHPVSCSPQGRKPRGMGF